MLGNYPQILIDLMKARGNWVEVAEDKAIAKANFIFRPVNYNQNLYKYIDWRHDKEGYKGWPTLIFNHFEF